MKLTVKRKIKSANSTIGELYIDNIFQCYTLEDVERKEKIVGKTAIPAGSYDVIINESNRFKRKLPLLMNVPNYAGVRIHPGNTAADTEGCILVGTTKAPDFVGNSREAFTSLFEKMLLSKTPITITIESTTNEAAV